MTAAGRWRDFENNGFYLHAITKELAALGYLADVVAAMPADLRDGLERPALKRWWPGAVLAEANELIFTKYGPEVLERIVSQALENSMLRVVEPLISIMLSIGGATPHTVFSKTDMVLSAGVRGLSFKWDRVQPKRGTWHIIYPSAVLPSIVVHYRPVALFAMRLTRKEGRILSSGLSDDGRTLSFDLEWL